MTTTALAGTYAAIIRVSDMGGRRSGDANFHSERDQIEAIRGVLPPGGRLEILPSELDVSGGLPLERRPSLLTAVLGVEGGKYAGIIVAYQSRLGRDVEHEEAVWRRVEAAGGRIILALDGIDSSTVDGTMVRRIRGAINHAERSRHVERFDALRQWATEAGIWQTSVIPFGYKKDPETRRLVVDPEKAPLVRLAFELKVAGQSLRKIALRLGISPSGVKRILTNRLYLGELHVGPYSNLNAHEPIVEPDLWLRAQHAPTTYSKKEGPALLTGFVYCAGCGYTMSRSGAPRSYACSRVHATGECPHPAVVNAAKLDAYVELVARAQLALLAGSASKADTKITAARTAVANAEAERDAYLRTVRATQVGERAFGEGLRIRQDEIDAAHTELALLLDGREIAEVTGDPIVMWDAMSTQERNHALRGLIEGVVVSRAGGRGGGRGRQTPLADRVRIIAHGARLIVPRRPIILPGPDADHVLGVDAPGDKL